jgi:hypothetical protein
MLCTPDDDRRFVAEHEHGVRHNREACFQLLKRLQREGPDRYAVVIPVPVLSRIPKETLKRRIRCNAEGAAAPCVGRIG